MASGITSGLNVKPLFVACCVLAGLTAAALHAQQKPPSGKGSGDQTQDKGSKLTVGGMTRTLETGDGAALSKSATQSKSRGTGGDPEPRHEPSSADILKELQKDARQQGRAVTHPRELGGTRRYVKVPGGKRAATAATKLLPDGSRLVDRPGRLTRVAGFFTFSFESRGTGAPELPMRLLPNRLLEDMEIVSAGGERPLVFIVSGEVTEYRGVNYLLVQKLLVRPDLGNLR